MREETAEVPEDAENPESEQELFEHHRFVVDPGQSMLRMDKYLLHKLEGVSRTRIQAAADAGNILINDKPVKSSYKVKPRDIIKIVLPHPPRVIELIPQNIPIDIVYEDDDLVIVNKQPGLVVHPGYGNYSGTLVNALLYHFQQLPKYSDDMRPGLLHRIDKLTSGLLVVAKSERALNMLAGQFFDHSIERLYYALVWGDFDHDEGTITGHLGRSVRDRKLRAVFPDGSQGKHAVTHYKVVERFGYITLVECRLETGRTHQIRVHMQYIGHPLFNDPEYGGNRIIKGTTHNRYKQFIDNCFEICPRQALHAKTLGFKHPNGEFMRFDSEVPADMTTVMEKFRRYAAGSRSGAAEE
ncbi:MAG: RluA family pseudouridine synthase [Bacteroidetes bacterium]|nr:MAG: RluA family pseudouridine synthase [Bacteroidota bacterium]